jgi:hypothetical protein
MIIRIKFNSNDLNGPNSQTIKQGIICNIIGVHTRDGNGDPIPNSLRGIPQL